MTAGTGAGIHVPLGEFDIIAKYFSRATRRGDVALGVGDDAALLRVPPDRLLVAAVDTLVEGRHFLAGTPADAIGHQALAVNLSDLAAMGADPAWALLSLSMPDADPDWLDGFARGFHALADAHGVALVGGDTVAGPRVITVTALGTVPPARALRRDGARPGDGLYVSGSPGLAAAGLALLRDGADRFDSADRRVRRFLRAEPRVALGRALRGHATAAMDVSDGLLADLAKLARSSGVGARVELEHLPVDAALADRHGRVQCERFVLSGGDDYELLFTLPAALAGESARLASEGGCRVYRIGEVTAGEGVRCTRDGVAQPVSVAGYDHFAP